MIEREREREREIKILKFKIYCLLSIAKCQTAGCLDCRGTNYLTLCLSPFLSIHLALVKAGFFCKRRRPQFVSLLHTDICIYNHIKILLFKKVIHTKKIVHTNSHNKFSFFFCLS